MSTDDQVVKAPASSSHTTIEQLAYLESFDAIVDKDYAFVIYKETKVDSGKWVIRIKGSVTAGTVFDPDSSALKNAFKKTGAHQQPYMIWGFHLEPKDADPRMVESRVLVTEDGKPTAIELHLVTRKADGSAMTPKMVSVPWP